ncbi:glycosyltransferase family 4 protein [Pseudotabrizicola alkalilacus]|uniref:Glycosyltransferase family 4 protein n=1 Tax=Pseudotabrizicola alkalilacus TaxID=2305252 RepID=A0A411Z333_9RHOB|nr:glycosyltransferase family 4 protein [Pseudotabrizicola alkalilacus]RGP37478.1 glycosyltransferase family 4 protein [Pseudotabrizicola alkalilacus]
MRIAQVAPLFEMVPPSAYGGTERIIATLCDHLVARGHDVTLFAAAGSATAATLVESRACGLREDPAPRVSPIAAHLAMLDQVRAQQAEFDVIHCHLSHFQHFPLFEGFAAKTLTTPHGRLDYADLPAALARWPDMAMNSISLNQRQPLSQANWVANIYHGLPRDLYRPLSGRPAAGIAPYLAFIGRFSRDKRADRAIAIAKAAGLPLKLAAKIDDDDRAWFHREIEPQIDGNCVDYVGEISEAEKPAFLGNAAALLFPIDWPEPFGLVVIEAMAHGTPVIAWRNGAMAEIVDDGVSGFVVDTLEQAIAAVPLTLALDRGEVRKCFERRFDAARMVDDYVAAYAVLGRQTEPVNAVF